MKYPIHSNLVGVGAVFEWVAGTKIKAPEIIANIGLEWILRLLQEPKRLLRRYLVDNFLFLYLKIPGLSPAEKYLFSSNTP